VFFARDELFHEEVGKSVILHAAQNTFIICDKKKEELPVCGEEL